MLRNLLLSAAKSPFWIDRIKWLGAKSGLTRRFVAGESLEEALPAVQRLHEQGLLTTLDQLGENTLDAASAVSATDGYIELLEELERRRVPSTISIKLTQLGLAVDEELCRRNLERILSRAAALENFVTIDMESSEFTEATLDLFREALARFGARHVGIVLQAYLYRTEADLRSLLPVGCHIRLCKGAYREPPEVAFPRKRDVNRNYGKLLRLLIESPAYPEIATHDEGIIRLARRLLREKGRGRDTYEFQMLFGIRRARQLSLAREGHRVRVYVPFGTQWAPYFTRRLAERPANLLFLLRNLGRR
ncbi:MAG: proline dehydrogenase [Acidobacteriota bacterium]